MTKLDIPCVSRRVCVCLTLLGMTVLAGCNFQFESARKHESLAFPLPESGHCEFRTNNGKIRCVAGDVDDVQIEVDYTVRGRTVEEAEANLELVSIEPQRRDGKTEFTLVAADSINASASLTVTLPSSMNLDLHTTNGALETVGMRGNVLARTSNGKLSILNAVGKIDAETSNGKLTIEGEQLEKVVAHTSNGAMTLTGTLGHGDHELHTSNGAMVVELRGGSARVTANTSNGSITANGNKIGSGESVQFGSDAESAALSITTSNGTIKISHRPSPSTETVPDEAPQA